MSHELRTPLNAIIGYSEMLLGGRGRPRRARESSPTCRRSTAPASTCSALINDILDLSKIEAGKMELYLETFDLAPLVDEVRAIVQPLVEKNGNPLVVDLPGRRRRDARRPDQGDARACSTCSATRQVHRERRGEARVSRGSAATAGDWLVLRGPRHRHRHDRRSSSAACSRPSPRPTPRRPASTAAPGWAWPSPGGSPDAGRRHRGRERAGQGIDLHARLPAEVSRGTRRRPPIDAARHEPSTAAAYGAGRRRRSGGARPARRAR